jgi:hypothetical protein
VAVDPIDCVIDAVAKGTADCDITWELVAPVRVMLIVTDSVVAASASSHAASKEELEL